MLSVTSGRENWTAGELPVAVGAGKFTAGAHLLSLGKLPATRKADLRSHGIEAFCRGPHWHTDGDEASPFGMQFIIGTARPMSLGLLMSCRGSATGKEGELTRCAGELPMKGCRLVILGEHR